MPPPPYDFSYCVGNNTTSPPFCDNLYPTDRNIYTPSSIGQNAQSVTENPRCYNINNAPQYKIHFPPPTNNYLNAKNSKVGSKYVDDDVTLSSQPKDAKEKDG